MLLPKSSPPKRAARASADRRLLPPRPVFLRFGFRINSVQGDISLRLAELERAHKGARAVQQRARRWNSERETRERRQTSSREGSRKRTMRESEHLREPAAPVLYAASAFHRPGTLKNIIFYAPVDEN